MRSTRISLFLFLLVSAGCSPPNPGDSPEAFELVDDAQNADGSLSDYEIPTDDDRWGEVVNSPETNSMIDLETLEASDQSVDAWTWIASSRSGNSPWINQVDREITRITYDCAAGTSEIHERQTYLRGKFVGEVVPEPSVIRWADYNMFGSLGQQACDAAGIEPS